MKSAGVQFPVHTECTRVVKGGSGRCKVGRIRIAHGRLHIRVDIVPVAEREVARAGAASRCLPGGDIPDESGGEGLGAAIESQAMHAAAGGWAPVQKVSTVGDLIRRYRESIVTRPGRRRQATLAMLDVKLGRVRLASLNPVTLRNFIDRRIDEGAGGVTIAADLSFLRRYALTVLHEQGFEHAHIELQLAHMERDDVSAAYNFATYLPARRKMMQAWADCLDSMRSATSLFR